MNNSLSLLCVLVFSLWSTAAAQITVGPASAPSGWKTGTGATTINFSPAFSFTPGTNGMLIVTVSGELTPNNPIVTYNGSAMTQAVGSNLAGSGNNGSYASVWYLLNPTVGNGALAVTTGGSVSRYNVYAIYATGVAQRAPQASLGASFVSQLIFETGFITPSTGALALTVLGGSVNGTGNSYSSSIHTSAGALAGQTQLPLPSSDNSIAAASYRLVANGTPIKGRGTQSSTTAGQPESVVIASFAPASLDLDHYEIAVPSSAVAGVVFNITITAKSITNVTVNDSTTVVTMSSSTAGSLMEFDWNGDGIYGDNSGTLVAGVKTIKARNKAAQTATIIATGGIVATTAPPSLTTTPGTFSKLQILAPGEVARPGIATGKSGTPKAQFRGIPFNVTVHAVDNNWNRVNNVAHTVRITSTDGTATLPANAPLSAGTRTFPITLNALGSFTLTAVDVTDGTKTSHTTSGITVVNGQIPGVNIYGSVPGLNPSNKYTVRVSAVADTSSWHPAFVLQTTCIIDHKYFDSLASWSHSYVNFEMSVPVVVEITSLTGPITSAVVHPARKSGGVRIENNKAYVTLNDPCNVHVDINGQMDTNDTGFLKGRGKWNGAPIHTLSIHANPELAGKPSLTDPNCFYVTPGTIPPKTGAWTTLYFLPGVHNIGVGYLLEKGHQYYIPGDAFVTGAFYSGPWGNGTNIRIFGHGTLSMAGIPHPEHAIPEPTVPHNPIIIAGAFNTSVEGITIADPAHHALQMSSSYNPSAYTLSSWVKIFGWRANGDGINPFGNGRISNCFIRTQDDCSYVNGAGMNDNVFWNDANGSTFVFNGVSNVTNRTLLIENCDVIYSRASWINWTGGRVFNMRGEGGGAGGTGIEFRNINISDPRPTMQTFFLCMETLAPYGNPPESRTSGHLSGVKFTNVSIAARNPNDEPETLWGSSSGVASIQNLTFDNLRVGGVTVLADIFKKNAHVSGLVFTDSTPVLNTEMSYEAGRSKFRVLNNGCYVGTPGATTPSIYNVINNGLYKVEASSSLGNPNAWLRVHTSTAPFEFSEMTQLPRYYRVVKP